MEQKTGELRTPVDEDLRNKRESVTKSLKVTFVVFIVYEQFRVGSYRPLDHT